MLPLSGIDPVNEKTHNSELWVFTAIFHFQFAHPSMLLWKELIVETPLHVCNEVAIVMHGVPLRTNIFLTRQIQMKRLETDSIVMQVFFSQQN